MFVTRSSDENPHQFGKNGKKQLVMGKSIESTLKMEKRTRASKNTTLICVTNWKVQADLNFKQQFDSRSFRLGL